MLFIAVAFAALSVAAALAPVTHSAIVNHRRNLAPTWACSRLVVRQSVEADDEELTDGTPSDVTQDSPDSTFDSSAGDEDVTPSDVEDLESLRFAVKARDAEVSLLRLCAATSRGAFASDMERVDIDTRCRELEGSNPTEPLEGRWRLVYSSEPGLYRSSPFFWGFSQLLKDRAAPLTPRNSKSSSYDAAIYAVTDALPFYEVGPAYHTIRPGLLVSEVVLKLKLFDALLPEASSTMTTTCTTIPSARGLTLTLETTQVKDSSIETLPGFNFVGDIAFPTQSAFATLSDALNLAPGAATVEMLTTYTSNALRITRTETGLLFVHVKDPSEL